MYLSIAGYQIQFIFLPTEWKDKKSILIELIKKYFKGFILKKSNKVDAKIFFKEISGIPFLNRDTKSYNLYFENKRKNVYETYYHTSIYELSQLLLIMIIKLLGSRGFLLHASGVKTSKGVVFFMGPSGAGKSTSLKMTRNHYPPFSDDCVIIKQEKSRFVCYQAPWIEKDINLVKAHSESKEIRQLCVIKKNKEFSIESLTSIELIQEIIQNAWTINGISKDTINCIGAFTGTGIKGVTIFLKLTDGDRLRTLLKSSS